jgi:hypothetical protein
VRDRLAAMVIDGLMPEWEARALAGMPRTGFRMLMETVRCERAEANAHGTV